MCHKEYVIFMQFTMLTTTTTTQNTVTISEGDFLERDDVLSALAESSYQLESVSYEVNAHCTSVVQNFMFHV